MSDHLLHLDSVDESGGNFRLECRHEKNDRWFGDGEDGTDLDSLSNECNLLSWWNNVGMELFASEQPVSLPAIPVHAEGWGYESPDLHVVKS